MLAYLVLSRESLCFSLIMNLRTSSSETSGSFSSFLAGAEAPQGMVTSVGSEWLRVAAEEWRTGALRTDWEEERGGSERSLVNVRCCRGHCGKLTLASPDCLTA